MLPSLVLHCLFPKLIDNFLNGIHFNLCPQIMAASTCCFCSVTRLCLTLCDPRNCSTLGFLILHHLPESAQSHSIELIMPSKHLVLCHPLLLLLSIFPTIRVFSNESVFCIRWSKCWSFSLSISSFLMWIISKEIPIMKITALFLLTKYSGCFFAIMLLKFLGLPDTVEYFCFVFNLVCLSFLILLPSIFFFENSISNLFF